MYANLVLTPYENLCYGGSKLLSDFSRTRFINQSLLKIVKRHTVGGMSDHNNASTYIS